MPTAPSSTSLRTRSYFGAKHNSSAYISFRLCGLADRDHLVGFLEREAQRLFDDDVLAGRRGGDGRARVQIVGNADVDDVAVGLRRCAAIEVGEPAGDAVLARERLGALAAARIDRDDFGVRHEARVRLEVNVGDEAGAEERDLGGGHQFRYPPVPFRSQALAELALD